MYRNSEYQSLVQLHETRPTNRRPLNSRHVVVFGQPEAFEYPSFSMLREIVCIPLRFRNCSTSTDRRQIEH